MFDQSGEIEFAMTIPSGDVTQAAMPTHRAIRRSRFPRRALPSVAETEPGTIMSKEVPFATRACLTSASPRR